MILLHPPLPILCMVISGYVGIFVSLTHPGPRGGYSGFKVTGRVQRVFGGLKFMILGLF